MKIINKFMMEAVCIILVMGILTGCTSKKETIEVIPGDSKKTEVELNKQVRKETEEEPQITSETMTIYDIEEGYMKVPYNPEIKHHEYHWENIVSKDSYKYYEVEGVTSSKIGVDVSKYQGDIDWKEVKDSGIEFAIIRAGFRGYGSGELVVDEKLEENLAGATEAGLEVGVYFFSQAVMEEEAVLEAEFVVDLVKNYDLEYPIIFDTEEIKDDTARTDNLSTKELTDITIAFCDRIKELGYETMIYANAKWLTTKLELDRLSGYEIWYADYQEIPLYPYDFSMWQYTEKGSVPGINGAVDLNIYFRLGNNR